MATEHDRTRDLTDDMELEDLVKELDAILDAWLMSEVEPALDGSSRARAMPESMQHQSSAA